MSAEISALMDAELRLERLLHLSADANGGHLPKLVADALVLRPRRATEIDAAFYQQLHDTSPYYQENNWLVGSEEMIAAPAPKRVIELGCGNGRFTKAIASSVPEVVAVDWARSDQIGDLPSNCEFWQADITKDDLPAADLACSADVLEHIEFERLDTVIQRWLKQWPIHYHIIACYDDKGSHLTVMPPGMWLFHFRRHDQSFRLASIEVRRNDPAQIVCTVTNIPTAALLSPPEKRPDPG